MRARQIRWETDENYESIRLLELTEISCPTWTPIMFAEIGMQAVLGLATLAVAWKCRAIFSEFNESGTILFVCHRAGSNP